MTFPHMPHLAVTVLSLALLIQGCKFGELVEEDPTPSGNSAATLSGTLVDAGGSPAVGAMVRVFSAGDSSMLARRSATAFLDSLEVTGNGGFSLSGLPHGDYALYATLQRGNTTLALFRTGIAISGNTNIGTDTLRVTGTVTLQVLGAGGAPLAGATCSIAGTPWQTVSDVAGVCSITGVVPGTVRVSVSHPAHAGSQTGDIELEPGLFVSGGQVNLAGGADTTTAPTDTVAPPGQHFPATTSTVAHWTFNAYDSAGKIPDLGPFGFHLSPTGAITLEVSPNGSAASLNGTTHKLSVPFDSLLTLAPTGRLTFEARIFMSTYPSGGKPASDVAGMYAGLVMRVRPDGSLQATVQTGTTTTGAWYDAISAPGLVPLNQWVNVAIAVDQTVTPRQFYGYIDGQPVQLFGTPTSLPIRIFPAPFMVGHNDVNSSLGFSGKIDEIRVSNSIVLGAGLPLTQTATTP